jgi:hypothetical protein
MGFSIIFVEKSDGFSRGILVQDFTSPVAILLLFTSSLLLRRAHSKMGKFRRSNQLKLESAEYLILFSPNADVLLQHCNSELNAQALERENPVPCSRQKTH